MTKERIITILEKIIKISIFFILFLPLVIHSHFFFPFIVVKNVLFRITVEIIFVAYLILAHLDSRYKPRFNRLTQILLAFFGILIIADLLGIGFYRSFWGNYERMGGIFHFFHLVLYFFVLVNVFKVKKDWHSFLTFSIFASALESFLGLAQWLEVPFLIKSSGGARLSGTVGNPTFFAAYLIFNLFFLLYFLAREKRFNLKLFSLSFLVFDAYLILAGIFYKLFATTNWHYFNFLKNPLLNEAFKYPKLFYPFLLFQILILATWFLRSRKNIVRIFLSVIFLFELFIFLNTQTRGAILGFWIAITFLMAVNFYLSDTRRKKILFFLFTTILLVSQLAMYQLGAKIVFSIRGWGPIAINSLGGFLERIAGTSSLTGFYISLFLISLVSIYFLRKSKFKYLWLLVSAFLILSPLFIYLNRDKDWVANNPHYKSLFKVATADTVDITLESRTVTWQASWWGWKGTLKSFLIGYGPENYYYAFNKYFPAEIYKDKGSQIWFDRAHNIIFDVGVTSGIIGLTTYLSLLFFATVILFRYYQQTKIVSSSWLLISLIIAYFLQNFFVFDTINSEIPFYLFLAFIVFLTAPPAKENRISSEKDVNYILISTLVIILMLGITINVKTLKANNYIFKALVPPKTSAANSENSFDYFKKAINEAVTGRFEAREQLVNYVIEMARNSNPTLTKEIIDYTAEELNKSIKEEPLNIRHYLWLSTFYNATVKFDKTNPQKVINLLKDAISLSPTRPQIYFEIAQAYVFLGDYENASKYFQKGTDLAPWVIDSHWNLMGLHVIFGKENLAEAELKLMQEKLRWQPTADDYQRLVDLYSRVKNYSKTIEFQKKIIEIEPSAEEYAKLAVLYAKIGENQKAKEATQKAVELDKNFAAEAEKFLEMLNRGELLEK